jgi:hypothetical protein
LVRASGVAPPRGRFFMYLYILAHLLSFFNSFNDILILVDEQ